MEVVLERGAKAGAREAMYVVLRLPLEIKDLFQEWLAAARPDRAARVMSLVRQMRGGRDYDPQWGARMRGGGPIADLLKRRFALACDRFDLNRAPFVQRSDLFRPPPKPQPQMDLFV
jgi:DNA repair photolyase